MDANWQCGSHTAGMPYFPPRGSCQLRTSRNALPALVTICCVNREPLLAHPSTARIVLDSLLWHDRHARCILYAGVVMPDHVHLVADPLDTSWRALMWSMKGFTAHAINKEQQRHGAVWQSQYHDRRISTDAQLLLAIEYCALNPVRAGLINKAADWPFFWSRFAQN